MLQLVNVPSTIIILREILRKMAIQKTSQKDVQALFKQNSYPQRKRFLQLKRSLCDQSFLIQHPCHSKLGLNCKSPSKVYLTAVNHRLFLKVKIKSVIILALKTLFPKFLYQVWFISFSVDQATNPITENALDILL